MGDFDKRSVKRIARTIKSYERDPKNGDPRYQQGYRLALQVGKWARTTSEITGATEAGDEITPGSGSCAFYNYDQSTGKYKRGDSFSVDSIVTSTIPAGIRVILLLTDHQWTVVAADCPES